jgi:hypothetical protein
MKGSIFILRKKVVIQGKRAQRITEEGEVLCILIFQT